MRRICVATVTVLSNGGYGFDKCLLEYVFGKVFILHHMKNVVVHFFLVTRQQHIESRVVAFGIGSYQLVVGELG